MTDSYRKRVVAHPLFVDGCATFAERQSGPLKIGIAIRRHSIKRIVAMLGACLWTMETIGDRVKEAANAVGGLNSLAKAIGMPRRTLGDQISGKFEVKLSFIVEVANVTGYSVRWLATGKGEVLDEPSRTAAVGPAINPAIFVKVKDAVVRLTKAQGVYLRDDELETETIRWYNKLATLADGSSDERKLASRLPTIEFDIEESAKKDAEAAKSGSGKRSA